MKAAFLKAYIRLTEEFKKKGYSTGEKDFIQSFSVASNDISANETEAHYIQGINKGKIKFINVPEENRTKKLILHTLSGIEPDIIEYVKSNPQEFDREFYKKHIKTNPYALHFEYNDFEFMPVEFIDFEMAVCAMLSVIEHEDFFDNQRACTSMDKWFYSIHKIKPKILTKDMYILAAALFDKKKILETTPKDYLSEEFYFALCLDNAPSTDIPKGILTNEFLDALRDFNDELKSWKNI